MTCDYKTKGLRKGEMEAGVGAGGIPALHGSPLLSRVLWQDNIQIAELQPYCQYTQVTTCFPRGSSGYGLRWRQREPAIIEAGRKPLHPHTTVLPDPAPNPAAIGGLSGMDCPLNPGQVTANRVVARDCVSGFLFSFWGRDARTTATWAARPVRTVALSRFPIRGLSPRPSSQDYSVRLSTVLDVTTHPVRLSNLWHRNSPLESDATPARAAGPSPGSFLDSSTRG